MSKLYKMGNLEKLLLNTEKKTMKIEMPNNSCFVDVEKSNINEDITLFKNSYEFNDDIRLDSQSNEEGLCINIVLDGELKYKDTVLDNTINKKTNTMFVKYINNSYSLFEAKKDSYLKDIGIIIRGDFLKNFFLDKYEGMEYLQKNYENNIPILLKESNTNIKTSFLANEIYNSPFYGDLDNLFLQSKVYEIIYNEFSDILLKNKKFNNQSKVKLSSEDIEALYKARQLICEERYFLNLNELSKKVALNEFKLKYGFRKLFNTSPGNMILEYRMLESKKLLETSEFNITEISTLVGYKYVQSFTNAFKKRFNVSPKDIMKTRKYYF